MQLQIDGKVHGLFMKAIKRRTLYPKTSTGALTLLTDADADPLEDDLDRPMLFLVEVTETFANGTGGQPTFKIGQTGTTNKFIDTSAFTGLTVGAKRCFVGTLTHDTDLIVTAVAATGTGTGAIRVTAVAFKPR